jgi:hypothetical protein
MLRVVRRWSHDQTLAHEGGSERGALRAMLVRLLLRAACDNKTKLGRLRAEALQDRLAPLHT